MNPLRWHGQLSHIALGCDDVDAAARFYARALGLQDHPGAGDDRARRLGWGVGQHALDLVPRTGDDLDHFALEIPDPDELAALLAALGAAGAAVEPFTEVGHGGEAYAISDPEGRRIELHGRVDRGGEHAADSGRRPVRLQHITLATTDLERALQFYVETLGFTISDRMGDVFAWLRCGVEHHTVALVVGSPDRKLDHFSFDLGAWSDFKDWCDRLAIQGTTLSWGPGRHGPGNNLFVMFDDPEGRHIELSAEMESFYDDRATYAYRSWDPRPETVNLWGPTPSWRAPQTGA